MFSLADFSPSLLKNWLNEFVGLADLAVPERGPGQIFNWSERAAHTQRIADVFSFSRDSDDEMVQLVECVPV